ncbi:hypothetical protein ABNB59_02595 [Paenibacillus larvae]|jgi:hypothetical protein|uniref:Uncharacterized protein n=4 Tax=Paenibacillus larvae TaxID=1464 RepID=V9WBF5_9BACL|nr:hypothetical protein [Paenibacillus larvae]AHD07050.1 hypothetical protein ERIC2_c33090 [Paenibacillus larvae subsp. larvae DSM 25430]AVF23129.1 hypothetical protein ERICI_03359 [Paenibacillus larvae subsp. larvae]AVF25631.1 hypothetical protein ERICIII_01442 [Paenibacillus larvae subsp. larvae]AVF30408.1 hypothetical protein ERICIV_01463 [Paenibacillus larvae subsp. larvae]AVG13614.1 hypothetical protein ERICII_03302 [Paenibacillus larvae subsp. larvae DSM 25430]
MSMYKRRFSVFEIIVFALLIIGLLFSLKDFWLPILVFGVLIALYKFPPNTWKLPNFSAKSKSKGPRRKNAKFRVIEGSKPDDDVPKYH